jgi:AcrR family transcriptional regulator
MSLDLDASTIVEAALDLLREEGLAAVSMRNVSSRLGVSPVPLYARVGNKEALLDAMARHLLADMAPAPESGEPWRAYAERWVAALRDRLTDGPDTRLLVGDRRAAIVEASRPLIDVLRAHGFAADAAVQACRLLVWGTVGFVVVETRRPETGAPSRRRKRPGGDPGHVSKRDADHLFGLQLRYLLDGIEADARV